MVQNLTIIKICFAFALFLNCATWFYTKNIQAKWINVPPPPSELSASFMTLGDKEFSYRVIGLMIQNFGNIGGRDTPIKDYDFNNLANWFFLQYNLSPKADHAPMLAAFYYGASQDPSKIRPILEYLKVAGNSTQGEKWRWLAHAVYLARFKLKDLDLALEYANIVANIPKDDMPAWAKRLPANVLNQRGEKEAALEMMIEIIKAGEGKIHPNEINSSYHYICEQILDEKEAARHDLCKKLK